MTSPIRIPTKECIELYENIEKNNYNCYPSYPAIDCNNISLIGRDGNMWTSIDNTWVCTGLINSDQAASRSPPEVAAASRSLPPPERPHPKEVIALANGPLRVAAP